MIDIPFNIYAQLGPRYKDKKEFTASDVEQVERAVAKRERKAKNRQHAVRADARGQRRARQRQQDAPKVPLAPLEELAVGLGIEFDADRNDIARSVGRNK